LADRRISIALSPTRVGIHGKPFELLKFRTMRTQSSDTVHREYVKEWIQRNAAERSDAGGAKIYKIGSDSRITPSANGSDASASTSCRNCSTSSTET